MKSPSVRLIHVIISMKQILNQNYRIFASFNTFIIKQFFLTLMEIRNH
jgi:hypothetical protein